MERKRLIGLDSKTYEHEFDRKTLATLSALPGFDKVVNFFLNWGYVKWHLVDLQGSNFQVTRESCPELYKIAHDAADVLDVHPMPRMYTSWAYNINGHTTGYKQDVLVMLNTGTIDLLTEDEMRFILSHEYGHIRSNHVLYHTMAALFNDALSSIPIAKQLSLPIQYGLYYWQRMSEFTSDRAGLLGCQNIDAALSAIIKMSGAPMKYYDQIDRDAFIKQAYEFRKSFNGFTDEAIKFLSILDSSHPWTVLRAAELLLWYESGEYQRILDSIHTISCPHCNHQIAAEVSPCPFCGSVIK